MAVVAYLDAGTGSLVASAAAAGFAGAAVAAKVGWRRVKGRLRPAKQDDTAQGTADDQG